MSIAELPNRGVKKTPGRFTDTVSTTGGEGASSG
jgi:hypothetical protein